jgi:SAM-dependent methyltransferase
MTLLARRGGTSHNAAIVIKESFSLKSDDQWKKFGELDPYFGVLADPAYARGRFDEAARAAFFSTGETHVRRVFDRIRERVKPGFSPVRALDFGCGVGRVLLPLASFCAEVVGVDVSDAMRGEAEANARRLHYTHVSTAPSDDRLSAVTGRFDFIHSYIVFQHMPPHRGLNVIARLMDLLEEGGVAALHVTHRWNAGALRRGLHRVQGAVPLVHRAVNALKRRPANYPFMHMYQYSLSDLIHVLAKKGATAWAADAVTHRAHEGLMLYVRRNDRAPAY